MNDNGRTIATESGRVLRIVEAGRPDGAPILTLHGTPGSRLLYHGWVEDAQARGIRLIGYDRPGYGGSTPDPGRAVAAAAEDVAAIAAALGLKRLAVWGISGGGPHALACAALLPELVAAAASLASPTPYQAEGLDWFEGMGEDNITEFGAALDGRAAVERFVEAATPGMLSTDIETLLRELRSLLSPADLAVLKEDIAAYLLEATRQGIGESRDGWIDDDLAFITPWGFDLAQIQVPVLLLHGEQDLFVPFSHGEWLAGQIPNAETRLTAGDGHLTLMLGLAQVHAWLLEKMK